MTDAIHSFAPDTPGIPKGKPGAAKEVNDPKVAIVSSGAKAAKVLGVKYRPFEESAKDSEYIFKPLLNATRY